MKRRIALSVFALALLAFAVGCDLYTGISVNWNIDTYSSPGSPVHVTYTVQNVGQYDLTGVNLQIGVDTGAGFYYTAWTSGTSLNKGDIRHGSIDLLTNGNPVVGVTVLAVDMDNPGT
jgi:hypothetical protein